MIDARRIRLCPDCSTIISNGAAFCAACSRRRFDAVRAAVEGVCPHCGKPGGVCGYSDGDCAGRAERSDS